MLKARFHVDPEGNTVPYPPVFDDIRKNYGFVDLRGAPDIAGDIFEARLSASMRSLLMELARADSPIFSLGSDVGGKHDPKASHATRERSGGYIQIISASYNRPDPQSYLSYCKAVSQTLRSGARRNRWIVDFTLKWVQLNLDNNEELLPSVWIWFDALGATPEVAQMSRESLISNLQGALLFPENLKQLGAD